VRPSIALPPGFKTLGIATDGAIIMLYRWKSLLKDDTGATAIEYGLIAALIAVAAIAAFQAVGTSLSAIFNNVATQL
jgi:pilus assembly protein Flp/PilA